MTGRRQREALCTGGNGRRHYGIETAAAKAVDRLAAGGQRTGYGNGAAAPDRLHTAPVTHVHQFAVVRRVGGIHVPAGNRRAAVDGDGLVSCWPDRNKRAAGERADARLGIHCDHAGCDRAVDRVAACRSNLCRGVGGQLGCRGDSDSRRTAHGY